MSFQPSKKPLKIFIIVTLLLVVSLIVGSGFSRAKNSGSGSDIYENLQLFAEVLAKVQNNYVEEVSPKKLVEGAIRGMIATLDPFSQFMDPEQYKDLETNTTGEFGGLGIQIIMKDNWVTVESPIEGTPAFKAGIKANDRIVKINDESTEGFTLEQAVSKMRGPKGTQVKIHIFRKGLKEPMAFVITRDIILLDSVNAKMIQEKPEKIGYIRIKEFREKTGADLAAALEKLTKDGMTALILDLRYNPGGLLDSSVEVSDLFLPANQIVVSTKGRAPGNDKEYRTSDGEIVKYLNVPMVVLVNEGSASAAEIVSGALQDHHRAILIGPLGKRTFGKGSVQSVMNLRNGTALRLTTAKYYTPSGKSIHGTGLRPDLEVEVPRDVEDSILFSGKLGELTVAKVTRTLSDESTIRFDTSETEKVEDAQLMYALSIFKKKEYFPKPGFVNPPPPPPDKSTTDRNHSVSTTKTLDK